MAQQINSDGTLAANNQYDAYGNKLNTGTSAPFGYGAQSRYYTDPETGMTLLIPRLPANGIVILCMHAQCLDLAVRA